MPPPALSGAFSGLQKPSPDVAATHFCTQKGLPDMSGTPFCTKTPSFDGLGGFSPDAGISVDREWVIVDGLINHRWPTA
jgi:hypothetical protein